MTNRKAIARRASLAFAGAALVGLTTSGCTSPDLQSPTPEQTTLSYVTFTGGDAGVKYENLIAAFEDANPGVDVKLEILAGDDSYDSIITSRIAAGTAPDIFEVRNNDARPYIEADLLTDLSDQGWVDAQIPTVANLARDWGGSTFVFVPEVNSGGVFYNVEIFDELGLEIPETWDDFLAVVKEIRAAGITPLSVGAKDGWTLGVQWTQMMRASSNPEEGAALTAGDISYSDASTGKIIPAFADLIAAGGFDADASGVDWPSSANAFALGQTAMMIQGTVALPAIRAAAPDAKIGMFPLPFVPAGTDAPLALAPAASQAIPVSAPHADLAKKFLDFWASPEVHAAYLKDASALSSLETSTADGMDPAFASMSELLETRGLEIAGFVRPTPEVSAAIQSGMQSLLVGSATVDEVLEQIDAAQAAN